MLPHKSSWSVYEDITEDFMLCDSGCGRLMVTFYGKRSVYYDTDIYELGRDYDVSPDKYAAVSYIYWGVLSFSAFVGRCARRSKKWITSHLRELLLIMWVLYFLIWGTYICCNLLLG